MSQYYHHKLLDLIYYAVVFTLLHDVTGANIVFSFALHMNGSVIYIYKSETG
jgi:hypothetical protein